MRKRPEELTTKELEKRICRALRRMLRRGRFADDPFGRIAANVLIRGLEGKEIPPAWTATMKPYSDFFQTTKGKTLPERLALMKEFMKARGRQR